MAVIPERMTDELEADGRRCAESRIATLPVVEVLRQLGEVIRSVSDQQYTAKPAGIVDSSVGGHVRHCLDHVQAFLDSLASGRLNYDLRERGTRVENCRQAALDRIQQLQCELLIRLSIPSNRPLTVSVLLEPGGRSMDVESSAGRELSFVVSHTIHHNALVGVIVRSQGVEPPAEFGCAPSTLRYRAGKSCAR